MDHGKCHVDLCSSGRRPSANGRTRPTTEPAEHAPGQRRRRALSGAR
jgi:hypothetical protein